MRPMRLYMMESNVDESTVQLRRHQAVAAYEETVNQTIKSRTLNLSQGIAITRGILDFVPAQNKAAETLFEIVEDSGKGKIAFFETAQQDNGGYRVKASAHFQIDPSVIGNAFTNRIDPHKDGVVEVHFYFGVFRDLRNLTSKNSRIEQEIRQIKPDEMFDAHIVLPVLMPDAKLEPLTAIAGSDTDLGKLQWFKAPDGSIFGVEIDSYAAEVPPYPERKPGVNLTKKAS